MIPSILPTQQSPRTNLTVDASANGVGNHVQVCIRLLSGESFDVTEPETTHVAQLFKKALEYFSFELQPTDRVLKLPQPKMMTASGQLLQEESRLTDYEGQLSDLTLVLPSISVDDRNQAFQQLKESYILQHNPPVAVQQTLRNISRNAKIVDLEGQNLDEVPDFIGALPELNQLYLGSNNLQDVPECIQYLSKLEVLGLSNNELHHLPHWIGSLSNLVALMLHQNQLGELPDTMDQLRSLKTLTVHKNLLSALPDSICDLRKLEHLNLASNQLTHLPERIYQLDHLEVLSLDHNDLRHLPKSFGFLMALQYLRLNGCPLESLPNSFRNLLTLKKLIANRTNISQLPDGFLDLNLDLIEFVGCPLNHGDLAEQLANFPWDIINADHLPVEFTDVYFEKWNPSSNKNTSFLFL